MTKNKVISELSLVLVTGKYFLVPANIILQKVLRVKDYIRQIQHRTNTAHTAA